MGHPFRLVAAIAVFLVAAAAPGCVGGPGDVGLTEGEILTPDISAYPTSGGVMVNYTGMSGGAQDWISIAHPVVGAWCTRHVSPDDSWLVEEGALDSK